MSEHQLRWIAARVDAVGDDQLDLFLPSFTRFEQLPAHPMLELRVDSGISQLFAIANIDSSKQTVRVLKINDDSAKLMTVATPVDFTATRVNTVANEIKPLFSIGQVIEVTAPFSQPDQHQDIDFYVKLVRKGITLAIPKGVSIADVMREHHLHVNTSCEYGVCGTCYTTVLSGEIIHEDTYLMDDEKAKQDCMMICVSRGKPGETLELDL